MFCMQQRCSEQWCDIVYRTTLFSNTPFTAMLMQILGDAFMLVVREDDKVCLKCNNIINQADTLRQNLMEKESIIKRYLNKKYDLDGEHDVLDVQISDEEMDLADSLSCENNPDHPIPSAILLEPEMEVEVSPDEEIQDQPPRVQPQSPPQTQPQLQPRPLSQLQHSPQPQLQPRPLSELLQLRRHKTNKPRQKPRQQPDEATPPQPSIVLPGGRTNTVIYGDGRGYYYHYNRISNAKRLVRCTEWKKKGCHARGGMSLEPNSPIRLSRSSPAHNHPPDFAKAEKLKLRRTLKDRALYETDMSLVDIVNEELSKNPVVDISPINAVRTMHRLKKLLRPPTPESDEDKNENENMNENENENDNRNETVAAVENLAVVEASSLWTRNPVVAISPKNAVQAMLRHKKLLRPPTPDSGEDKNENENDNVNKNENDNGNETVVAVENIAVVEVSTMDNPTIDHMYLTEICLGS